eukprot:XP_019928020.1 PREDICTED: uncharacterized protein LOC105340997 [Crassostrea gigas]
MKLHRTILVISLPVIMAVRATITMDTQDIIARALVDILVVTATVITVKMAIPDTLTEVIPASCLIILLVARKRGLPVIILLTPTKSSMLFMTRTITSSFVNIGFKKPVDCFLPRNEGSYGYYYNAHATIPPAHHVTGSTHHTVHLRFNTDSSFQHPKSLYGSKVGDTVYVNAFTDVRDYNQKMRLSDCYTTPTSSSYSSLKYFKMGNANFS